MSNNQQPVQFATVFRNELAAIADRRRFQRMEALRQLGADGDYSKTSRKWAVVAAEKERLLAQAAAAAVAGVPKLLLHFIQQEQVDVQAVRRELLDISQQTLPEPPQAGSVVGGPPSHRHLKKSAADAAAALTGDSSALDAGREVQAHLYRLLVAREPKPGPEAEAGFPQPAGDMQELEAAKGRASDASAQAAEQEKVVKGLGVRIKTAALANTASEVAWRVQATAALFDGLPIHDKYEVFAVAARATEAVLFTCNAVLASQTTGPAGSPAADQETTALLSQLTQDARQLAERMAELFRTVVLGCASGLVDSAVADRARQALRGVLKAAVEESLEQPGERQQTLLEAESLPVDQLTARTLDFLGRAIVKLGARLRPAEEVTSPPRDILTEVSRLSRRCVIQAFTLLPGEKARRLRQGNVGRDEPLEPDVRRARETATDAVQELGKAAVRVAEWAWAAETEAAQAVREAIAILANRFRKHPPAPEERVPPGPEGGAPASGPGGGAIPPPGPGPGLKHLRTQALDQGLVGLAFSGGGIRSATFSLGILQALGHLRLLRFVDYLSTVSGGGYIGSWLAAWVRREQSLINVEKQLDPDRVQQAEADRVVKVKEADPGDATNRAHPLRPGAIDDEPEPVQHLRAYSRYLAPRLFSADTWTLGAIYVRNLVVTLASLAPWLFSLLIVSRLVIWLFTLNAAAYPTVQRGVTGLFLACIVGLFIWGYGQRARLREAFRNPLRHPEGADRIAQGVGTAVILTAVVLAITYLWLLSYSPGTGQEVERFSQSEIGLVAGQAHLLVQTLGAQGAGPAGPLGTVMPVLAAAEVAESDSFVVGSLPRLRYPFYGYVTRKSFLHSWPGAFKMMFFGTVGGFLLSLVSALVRSAYFRKIRGDLFGLLLFADALLGMGLGLFLYLALDLVVWPAGTDAAAVVTFGVPALVIALVLADYLEMLVVGSFLDESEREWRSRIGAYLFMVALGWLGFFSVTLYLPWAVQRLAHNPGMVASGAAVVWAAVSGLGAWAGRWMTNRSASGWSIPWLSLLAGVAPPVFLVGLLAFAAALTFLVSPDGSSDYLDIACAPSGCAGCLLFRWLAVGIVGVVLVWNLIRVNLFSMHMMYANRLIRCYLGASRRKLNWKRRAGGPLGSPKGLSWLWGPGARGGPTNADNPPLTPHITTLRITFTEGEPGSYQLAATGAAPITYAPGRGGNAPPGWLNLSSAGLLTGTPSPGSSGTITFQIIATNSLGTDTDTFILTLNLAPAPQIQTLSTTFIAGKPGSYQLATTGKTPITYAPGTGDNAPPGWVSLSPAGLLTGTPPEDAIGPVTFQVRTRNAAGADTQTFTLTVQGPRRDIARREPTFTDFDPSDDFPLHELRAVAPAGGVGPRGPDKGYRGPYPLLNTALNLVGSADLAIQDRRAASFVLTPDFCGTPVCGFARTRGDALTLGRALTVSGAAVDPNMGVYYSPQLTALMTTLNTRLGWWLQNPERWGDKWEGAGPGPHPLILWELFGLTNETSRYVHLSDGGHFENLGVYELIRRRCRFLVVADVTTDRHAATDNLANLIRLVRTDFGVGIQIDTGQLAEDQGGRTRWHCAIGLVHYEDVDPSAVAGVLVYLYASLTGDEPPDVQQYAQTHADFPHETTLDQFFSEAQFESYRALGYHIATEVFGGAAETMNRDCCDPESAQEEVRKVFSEVRKRWFPAPPEAERQFLPAADLHRDIERELRWTDLQRLRQELYPEVRDGTPPQQAPTPAAGSATATAELHMTAEMLRVMEMVWYGMKLDASHAHPLNRGWMNLFRRWTNSPTFHRHWPYLRGELSQGFVEFCERALNLATTNVIALRMDRPALRSWLPEVREMDLEFEQEWASERDRLSWLATGRYALDAIAVACQFQPAQGAAMPTPPLVWRLALRDDRGTFLERSAGVICVGPPTLGAGRDLELFLWLRGSYRNLRIGRVCLKDVLRQIDGELRAPPRADGQRWRLVTYHPDRGVDRAERLAKAQWMNFFFDHGFRSLERGDPSAEPGTIALAREVQ
jgi:hypothetical protein